MAPQGALNLGYPTRVKAFRCLPLLACFYAVWRTISGPEHGLWDVPVLFGAIFSCVPALYGVRAGCRVDADGMTRRSPWGEKRFRREDFLGHERIAAEPGTPPGLLVRFKTGVVFLAASQIDRSAQEVVVFCAPNGRFPRRTTRRRSSVW